MDFTSITKLSSTIILASLLAFLISASPKPAIAQHTVTINNYCSETIWVGANPKVQSVMVGGQSVSTLGGWEMASGQTATVQVPLNWNSGRFWARTGCGFNAQNVCPAAGVGNNPPPNCCDTGGCTNASGQFALDCDQTGQPPATLAEITFVSSGQDSYDVSMVDGGNVSVDMVPDPSTYECTGNSNCIFTNNLPNKNSPNCTQDSDCYPLFGFGFKWRCDPKLNLCVNPHWCGSPGCTDKSGCAPQGITQSVLPSSNWDPNSDFAIPQSQCSSDIQVTDTQNQGSTYVGCIAPQKFCRKSCTTNSDCTAPFTCGSSGFCEKNGVILGADCDTTVGSTTKENLWGCTGPNSGSCFTTNTMDPNCCGCPTWAPGFPNGFPDGACVAGNNQDWQNVAQPIAAIFNTASPTTYAFPFDDAIKLFDCQAKSGSVTAYTVNFCPNDADGDGIQRSADTDTDGDGITNEREMLLTAQNELSDNRQEGLAGTLDDADADGLENWVDLDSDNDGVPDHTECGGTADSNSDGLVDNQADSDGDGLPDVVDSSEGGSELECIDTEGDGLPDFIDVNSDDQGGTDFEENRGMDGDGDGLPDNVTDENEDGLLDQFDPDSGEPLVIGDSDQDGIPNHLDADNGGNGGCSIAAHGSGMTPASILWLFLPALILLRRFARIYK